MPGIIIDSASISCTRRLRVGTLPPTKLRLAVYASRYAFRYASDKASPPQHEVNGEEHHAFKDEEQGAMTRRLRHMAEESLDSGDRSAQKAVAEARFSEDLKQELEKKIADANFRSENAIAFAQVNIPASANRGTRDQAAARPWTGTETVGDVSLRMLDDAHKPLRRVVKSPSRVDAGRPKGNVGTGIRLASARERSSLYEAQKDVQQGLTDEERDKFRQQLKARFHPGARPVAATITGLQSLANQRIEEAIGRGQFKNLPDRGKKIERDYNANSPFINTTEYFMNKMIKKQDIVPPWIEKQQEIISTANVFRRRLRVDWKRHVSRIIASRGGPLESQMKLAEEYAFAESIENPSQKHIERMNAVDDKGHLSQITLQGERKAPISDDATAVEDEIKVTEQTFSNDGSLMPPEEQIVVSSEQPVPLPVPPIKPWRQTSVPAFRDTQWEETERSYHQLAIQNLNSITRSYNLMAPDLAKKPYFSLERELRACFADVAPQVAAAIRQRALAPKIRGVEVHGHKPGGVLEKFSMDKASHVYDERKPQYGLKEFWRDLFAP